MAAAGQSKRGSTAAPALGVANIEPRWPAIVALLAIGGLRLALPAALSAGPRWLMIPVVLGLAVPTVWARHRGLRKLNQLLGYLLVSVVTLDMIWSLSLLLTALPSHREAPADLLRSAAALWCTNILVFASWYWRLDAGGPAARELNDTHTDGAFLFPQMTLLPPLKKEMGEEFWHPGFVDYLFLAFNTSTAFSPTDTPVLSRWAKGLVMTQALISFTTVALLAARGSQYSLRSKVHLAITHRALPKINTKRILQPQASAADNCLSVSNNPALQGEDP